MKAEVDLKENATYYVRDGKLFEVDGLPCGYGKQIIVWQDGKPIGYDINYTKRER